MLWLIGITVLAFALTSALVTFVTTLPSLRTSKPTQYAIIVADIILLTLLYIYTGNPQSDFFLFYYLPALTSAEYLPTREMLLSFFLELRSLSHWFSYCSMHPFSTRCLMAASS
jgi:hypothetical protein